MEVVTVYTRPKRWFSPISWLIRLIEMTSFSHVAVLIYFESVDKLIAFEASGTQVKFVNYKDWSEKNEIVHAYVHNIKHKTGKRLVGFCFDNVGKRYGKRQLIGMMIGRLLKKRNPFRDGKKSYVCSELVGYILADILGENVDLTKLEYEGPKYLQKLEELHEGSRRKN